MQNQITPEYLATLSDEQYYALLDSIAKPDKPKPKPYIEPTPPRDMGFMEGNLKKAWGGFGQMAGGALGLVGDLVGSKDMQEYGLGAAEGAQAYNRDIDQRMITPETNLIDTYEKQGLWEAAKATPQFVAEQAVQNLPMMIGTGGVGGLVGKSATKSMLLKELSKRGLAAEAVKEGVEKTARKHLGDDVLTAIANKGGMAATGASGAQWSGLESGSIYADQPVDQKDPLKALAYGTAAGMLEPLPEAAAIMRSGLGKKILTGVGKEGAETYKQAFKNVGVDLLKQAPMEGAQEMVQTGLEQAGAHKDPFTEESFKEQVVGGIAGMGIGGAFGGATSTYQNFPLKKKIVDNKTEVDLTGDPNDLKTEAAVENDAVEVANTILNTSINSPLASLGDRVQEESVHVNKNIQGKAPAGFKGFKPVVIKNDMPFAADAPMFDPVTGEILSVEKNLPFEEDTYEKYIPSSISPEDRFQSINAMVNPDPQALAQADIETDTREIMGQLFPGAKWTDLDDSQKHAILDNVEALYVDKDKALFDLMGRAEEEIDSGTLTEDTYQALRSAYKEASPEIIKDGMSRQMEIADIGKRYKAALDESKAQKQESINVYYGTGENAHFSNLAHRPFEIGGRKYLSVEHAYQSNKSGSFDQETYDKYKKAGVKIAGNKGTDTKTNMDVMAKLMYQSFKQNPEAARKLIETGGAEFSHKQDKTIWKEAFPRLLKDVRDALIYEQQYGDKQIAQEQPKQGTKNLFPKKDIVPSSLDVENGSGGAQSIVSPSAGSKNVFASSTQSGDKEVSGIRSTLKTFEDRISFYHVADHYRAIQKFGKDSKMVKEHLDMIKPELLERELKAIESGDLSEYAPIEETSKKPTYGHGWLRKVFENNGMAFTEANKLRVAKSFGAENYFQLQSKIQDKDDTNALAKKIRDILFKDKEAAIVKRLGGGTADADIERFLDSQSLLTEDARKAIGQRELTVLKRTGEEENPESKEYLQFQRKVHSPNFTTSKPSYDEDAPQIKGKHRQKDTTEDGAEGLIKDVSTNEDEYKKRLLRVEKLKKRSITEDQYGQIRNNIIVKIKADNNQTESEIKRQLEENKLLSPEEKQEIIDFVSGAKEEGLYLLDLYEELKRTGEVNSFKYLDAVPDMISNVDVDDLESFWGKKGGQQKIEDNLDGTFSRNEDYVGEGKSEKLKVKPTHRYGFVKKGNGKVGIKAKSQEARLQNEKEQQAAAYKVFVDYKVEERQNDIENVYDVLKAIKEIADSGLRSKDSILRAKDVLKKRPMLRGKDQKAKLESIQRIMSGNRLIISGEWVPVYNVSNEWIGLDKVGNEEHTYSIETEDGKVKQYTGTIPTEYNVSENVFELSREITPISFDPSYAAELDVADPHEMKRDGIQTIDSGSIQGGGQTVKSYVTKAAIDKMLELGISRGFATEKHREIIEKHNSKIVALQEERDAERQKRGVLSEDGQLRIPKTKTEDKEKYYLEEIATENRKMVAVLLPIKANMLKAQLKSVFFEDKNFFEKESDRYVSQGFTKEFLHALAKESLYDRAMYESRVNREVQRKNQELADKIFFITEHDLTTTLMMDRTVYTNVDLSSIHEYLFSLGNFTQQERENFAKYDDSVEVENVIEETDEEDSSVKTKTKSKTLVRFVDTLTTQEREKLEIFKVLQQRLLDVAKGPEKEKEAPFDKKASDKKFLDNEALAGYMANAEANNANLIFTTKSESEKSLLEKSVEQFFTTRHPDEKVSLGKLRDQSQQNFFEKFAKLFGAELVVIRDYREKHKQFQGKYFVSKSGKPVIIVNANGTSFGRVFAHELFHHIVNKANPKEYQAFKDAVLTNIPESKFEEAIEKARTIWSPYMTKAQAVRIFSTSEFNTSPKRVMSSDNESTARRPEKLEKLVSTIRTKLDDTSSNWSTSTYETGLQSVFPDGLKQELEEEIFAEMFSFAFNTKDFWENMSKTPAGVSLSQKLIKGFIDILNKVLDFFNKNIKQLNNGIFGIKGLVAHDNWFDDIVTGDEPIKGAFSLMYDLMGAALDSNTLNNASFKAEQIDNSKMLPTIEEVKNHIANHATYKKIFPNGINSYKDVMTAVENLLSNLKTWIVKNMPSGVFTHVGASEPVKKIVFSVAHGGMLEAQKAYLEAVEPHAKVFDKMTTLELEAFVDDVTKNGLENVTPEQKEALLAMQRVADETFAKLKKYFPYLQQRENHFGLSIKWLNKDRTLFEDEFEWEAYGSKLEGNKRFMKEKSDLSIAEIREKYNLDYETIRPQKLFLRYIKDAHYLMNFQEQMKDARKEDIARYFTDQKEAMEAGYVPVNDNALKVFQRMGFSDGYKIKLSDGTYYSQNETPVYFSSEYEANKIAEAIRGAYESVEVEKFTPDKLVKVAYFDIYTEVDGKELFVSSAKTQKEAERIAKKNPDYFIKERIASQQDSVIAQMYFKPDMAKMMNSLLSYDGFKNFKAFGVSGAQAMDLKNIATSMELAFSMFHAFTIGQESISSYAAWQQGLKKMGIGSGVGVSSYNPTKVVTESKKIVTLMKDALKQGNTKEILARAEALLGIKNPDVLDIMTQYYKAGGQLGQDSDLRGSGADVGHVDYSSLQSFFGSFKDTYNKEVREFKQKNPDSKIKFGASISWDMFKYTAHASSAWLMEEGIPKMKMAQFAREYSLKLEQHKEEIAAGIKTKEQIAIDTILFIEDRFGEVNWKNKWLDATYKTSLQFAFRSFTWIAGTYVALGKTMPEYAKLGWFKLKGEEYHLTEKGLWGIHVLGAHIFTAALLSSVYTLGAALSGDEQKTDEDTPWLTRMLFPRIDPYDNTRRLSVPSYVTEFYKIATHLGYGGNPVEVTKLISGRFNSLLSKSVELAKNEDFRGTLIRNPKDSIVGQTADVIQHIIPLPISWGTIIKDAQKEGLKPQSVMTGLMGFTDAPASAKRSVAANTAYKIGRKEYKGKETTEDKMELKDELSRAMSAYKSGDKSKVEKLLAEGRISTRQFQIALERTPIINGRPNPVYKDQLKQQVTRLTIDGSLDVWEKMSANEKNKHRADIIKKYSNMLSRQDKPLEEKKKITARMKELGIIK